MLPPFCKDYVVAAAYAAKEERESKRFIIKKKPPLPQPLPGYLFFRSKMIKNKHN